MMVIFCLKYFSVVLAAWMVAEAKWQEYFLFLIVSPMRRDYLLEWEFLATCWLTLSEMFYIELFPSDSDTTKLNCFNGTLLSKIKQRSRY
jgi:hypothetical protein